MAIPMTLRLLYRELKDRKEGSAFAALSERVTIHGSSADVAPASDGRVLEVDEEDLNDELWSRGGRVDQLLELLGGVPRPSPGDARLMDLLTDWSSELQGAVREMRGNRRESVSSLLLKIQKITPEGAELLESHFSATLCEPDDEITRINVECEIEEWEPAADDSHALLAKFLALTALHYQRNK